MLDAVFGSIWGWIAIWLICVGAILCFLRVGNCDGWREDAPTDRQMQLARELGVDVPRGATRGQVSDLIARAQREKSSTFETQ